MTRILVIQLKRMSELLLTTPMLAALRAHDKEAHITLAIESNSREFLPAFDFIDESYVFSRRAGNREFWRKLLFASYDICLDCTGNERSAICSMLSKSKRRITFESGTKPALQSIFYNEFVRSPAREHHAADHYMHLLQALKITPQDARPRLALPEWADKKAGQLLEESGVTGPYVLLHPGTLRPEKYWLPERWAEVLDFCKNEMGLTCVVTGASDTAEAPHIAAIRARTAFHDLTERTDLLTLAALIRRARLLLTVDSAAMHLGAAFETPQVALFGKTNAFHWRPRNPHAQVIQAGQALGAAFSPRAPGAPMSEVSTAQVFDAIRIVLNPASPGNK
ncbi:MAG TPA: glycosyltransferase family 9 protein [Chthoniobacteraceae bacterium]|nr:glycosyltransferase family 9 protein [Chthoniobacteraceae bacterium]